ncbi:MAG: RDD family protein [Verrucomicrobiota bacterium]
MKRFKKNLLGLALATGLVWSPATPLAAQTNEQPDVATTNINAAATATDALPANTDKPATHKRRGPVVSIGGSSTTAAGESAEVVVAIGGSSKAGGKVREAVVAIGGDATAEGDVGDAVVAIGGDAAARGKVGDAVVAVAGNAAAFGEVGDAVVAVMGDVRIGSNAVVRGDVVSVGGKVEVEEGAQVKGQIVEVGVAQYPILAPLKGVAEWLRHCALKFRLLAPQPGWYWIVAGIFLLLYLLIAAATPRPVAACVKELSERPATTFLIGLLMKLLVPLVMIVLAITGIGMIVIPFIWAALFIAGLIGKVALFEYLGGKILNLFGVTVARPVLTLLAGFALITLFYMVPLLSLLIYLLVGIWALGTAVTATFNSTRKEAPPRPPYAPTNATPPGPPPPSATGFAAPPTANFSTAPDNSTGTSTPSQPTPTMTAPTPEAYVLPRAGFWERMGAAFLDVILVAFIVAFIAHSPLGRFFGPPITLAVALAYFAGMWAWKGSTIGGTVLNLRVVRLDNQPVTFAVALVRGLASMLSFVVFFLGFFWIIVDRDKQSWHDKIAGTVVVRTPRATPLVCL